MDKLFRIGNFCFRILCDEDFAIPPNFLLFEIFLVEFLP